MKKLLIIIGAVLILLVVGAWVYLLMYGAPKSADEVFSRFGLVGGESLPEVIVDRSGEPTIDVGEEADATPERLRQLTVRPVAGATFTKLGIIYVEEGTGHVYHIDLDTGEEKLLSGTTIPGAHDASFSADGSYVTISSIRDGVAETIVGFIDTLSGSISGVSLPPGAREIAFSGTSSLLMYLLPSTTGSSGYSYDIGKGIGIEVFRIPLRDVRVLWGTPTYVYTTPSAHARGYLYRVVKNDLGYIAAGGFGLTARSYDAGVVITTTGAGGVVSSAEPQSGTTTGLSLPFIPEKCVPVPETPASFYCGVPNEISAQSFPDSWYMGIVSYSDTLFAVDVAKNEWVFWTDLLEASGREVDIGRIGTDGAGELIYFINKNDNTLWMFDTTL